MVQINIYNPETKPNPSRKSSVIDFLYRNLEDFGDPKPDIKKAVDFALKENEISLGGFIVTATLKDEIVGATVLNKTGMKDYIPENILVYIATHKKHRGEGIGKKLMKKTIDLAKGDIALHVEEDNPARFLYEKVGFGTKYIEMRYRQDQ